MRTKDEIRTACAAVLQQLRLEKGFSKERMAREMYVDPKTWARWESGESMPSVADFMFVFEESGTDSLPMLLKFMYPDKYGGLGNETQDVRTSMANYLRDVASDRMISTLYYLLYGNHGSNIEAQVQELLMLDHLPLIYRYVAANSLKTCWDIACGQGELLNEGYIMPNMELFNKALDQAHKAAVTGKNNYVTIKGKE